METDYTLTILVTFFGFLALAALLLVPIYRFLGREEKVSRTWTKDALESRATRDRNGEAEHAADAEVEERVGRRHHD